MDYIIEGGNKLYGEISLCGSKNCALALLGATVLTDDEIILKNCPQMTDVQNMILLLQRIGKKIVQQGEDVCVSGHIISTEIPCDIANQLRGSVLVLGGILAKYGNIRLPMPGGCNIGTRPIDIHLDGLRNMDVSVQEEGGFVVCKGFPQSTTYTLRFASVGATQNLLCACLFNQGITVLRNCAVEPEIVCLEKALAQMGAKIDGIGTSTLTVRGVQKLHGATITVIPDRIVCATYLSAVVCAEGSIAVTNCQPKHLQSFIEIIKPKCNVICYDSSITVTVNGRCDGYGYVQTAPYPKFPTDMQSLLLSMASCACGKTEIEERLFENRLLNNAQQLTKMGANITIDGNKATVVGTRLVGAKVQAFDLRGGAGLVVAGLGAKGVTTVGDVHHINRGYINLAQSLSTLGAKISII